MIRDQALVLSGRFSPKMYGPPVMPPQPDGIWRSVYNDRKWETAQDENRYRRAIYTYLETHQRVSQHDDVRHARAAKSCTARRIATNTPLQALVTLNDEAYVELRDRLGRSDGGRRRRVAGGANRLGAIKRRPVELPQPSTLADLDQACTNLRCRNFVADPERCADSCGRLPSWLRLSVVASAILNLDEVLTR